MSARRLRIAQVAVMAASLTVPLVLFLAGQRSAEVDNARREPRPDLIGWSIFDTDATDAFDRYVSREFPLRDEAIRLDARLAKALGDSSNPEVSVGSDGWLFYRPSLDQPCLEPPLLALWTDALARVDRVVAASGRTFTYVIAPDKAAIFPEYVEDSTECVLATAAALERLDTTVDVVAAFEDTRSVARTDPTAYRRYDTHWNNAGAVPTAAATIGSFDPGLWRTDAVTVVGSIHEVGDLSTILGLPQVETNTLLASKPNGDEPVADALSGTTTLLHDSFGVRFVPLVAPYFADLTSLRGETPRPVAVHEPFLAAERLIQLHVQRSVVSAVHDADLAADYAAALRRDLPAAPVRVTCGDGCTASIDADLGADLYLIATLRDGEDGTGISVDGRMLEFDELRPVGAWLVGGTARLNGDVDAVDWTAVSVGR